MENYNTEVDYEKAFAEFRDDFKKTQEDLESISMILGCAGLLLLDARKFYGILMMAAHDAKHFTRAANNERKEDCSVGRCGCGRGWQMVGAITYFKSRATYSLNMVDKWKKFTERYIKIHQLGYMIREVNVCLMSKGCTDEIKQLESQIKVLSKAIDNYRDDAAADIDPETAQLL